MSGGNPTLTFEMMCAMEKVQIEKIQNIIIPIIQANDSYLYKLEYVFENESWILRVLVEKNSGNTDLDTCVGISEEISAKLDELDFLSDEYILEVSSPGAERPLETKEQFYKAMNKQILVILKNEQENYKQVVGKLVEVKEDSFIIEMKIKTRAKKLEIDFSNVEKSMTTVKI